MYIYILDSLLRRNHIIEKFESLIWTERYAEYGDFELLLPSSYESRRLFSTGSKLVISGSKRVMVVDSAENKSNEDGSTSLLVKGFSLEKMLTGRVAKDTMSDLTTEPTWDLTGTPGDIVRTMFNDICVLGTLSVDDIIPHITPGNIFPEDTNTEPQTVITHKQEPKSLYDAIKEVSDLYDLGFRLVRNGDTSQLHFNVYVGSDRTSNQSTLNPVIFAADLDNLKNTVELSTIENYMNVAYVFSPVGSAIVFPEFAGGDITGIERRVLTVIASDIDHPTEEGAPQLTAQEIQDLLTQRGREELSKHRGLTAFDGELYEVESYKYEEDYYLGDLVEMRNRDGATNYMRVTEQIFVSDAEGDRSYPTLSTNEFINAGSWLSWDFYQVWEDMGLTEYWDTV